MRSAHKTAPQLVQVPQVSMPLRSRGFVGQSGHTQLSPHEVYQLGLCEERRPKSHSQTEGPHSNVCQPGWPALLTAEEHLRRDTTVMAPGPSTRISGASRGQAGGAEAQLLQLGVR